MKKALKYIFYLGLAAFVAVSLLVLGIFFKYKMELPDVQELVENYELSLPSVIYDRQGREIDKLYQEAREVVDIDEVPKLLQESFIAIEDKRFYQHHGLDPKGLSRAVIVNLTSGRARQGASSITQQLAKNAFLSMEKTIARKVKELIITLEIERVYTKNEILEKYLNEIYFGSGAYGVKRAAKQYFHKSLEELNIAEMAMLAGIPNRPEGYNPRRHLDRAVKRMKLVLGELKQDGKITEKEYEVAKKRVFVEEEDATPAQKKNKNVTIIYPKQYSTHYKHPEITRLIEDYLLSNYEAPMIYHGGLQVYSSFDLPMQEAAKESFDNYPLLKKRKKLEGAMMTIDPFTGDLICMVGGKDFKAGNFNRALMAKRQFGSAFKPFVYFTGLLYGYDSNSIMEDSEVSYGKWTPRNASRRFRNENVTLKEALDRSINSISVKLLAAVGNKNFQEVMAKIAPNLDVPDNLTAALGTAEGSSLDLALAYAIFVNGGHRVEPVMIHKIEDKHGNLLYQKESKTEKIFESVDTSAMCYMLQSSVSQGTSRRARVTLANGQPMTQGGKTGTTNRGRTVWYAGICPEYVTVSYLGYDDNRAMPGLAGGNAAAPLYHDFYQNLVKKNLYQGGKFSFLEDHLKNGELVLETLDPRTGMLSLEGDNYVLRRGHMEVEETEKYKKGIAGFFAQPEALPVVEREPASRRESEDSLFQTLMGD